MIDPSPKPYSTTAVLMQDHSRMPRRYWFAWWLGTMFGPLLMAILRPREIYFGHEREGKFRMIVIKWKKDMK